MVLDHAVCIYVHEQGVAKGSHLMAALLDDSQVVDFKVSMKRCVGERGAKTTSKIEDNRLRLLVHAAPACCSEDELEASEGEDGTDDEGFDL